ncbi:MAG: fatty acyl CoA synthetase [Lysobacter sp.]|nr:fatty acyl CoA synthetase [Lysobacter sp.]
MGALLLATLPLHAAPPEAGAVRTDWILEKLARPAPSRTGFVELRGSALLKAPLRISGEYRRPSEGILVREVSAPYAETTTITASAVTIERAGKRPRTFALSRAPELAGLQASFGALLTGDRAQLEQHYRVTSTGTRGNWTLALVPRHAELAAKLEGVTLYGRGAELRCIETVPAGDGDLQRTLLAGAASKAGAMDDPAALAALCRGKTIP